MTVYWSGITDAQAYDVRHSIILKYSDTDLSKIENNPLGKR